MFSSVAARDLVRHPGTLDASAQSTRFWFYVKQVFENLLVTTKRVTDSSGNAMGG